MHELIELIVMLNRFLFTVKRFDAGGEINVGEEEKSQSKL